MKRKISTVITALLLCAVLAISASADVLYTAQATYSDPAVIGTIRGTNAPARVAVTTTGSAGQRIANFTNAAGASRVALALCGDAYGNAADTIWIYDPAATAWTRPLAETKNDHLTNMRAMASLGGYLYGITYGGNVSRFDTADDKYTADNTVYNCNISGRTTPGEGLVAYGGYLYAIFSDHSGYTDYKQSHLVKLNADLSVAASADIYGKNVNGMGSGVFVQQGNKLYVVSNGDSYTANGYNPSSLIEVVDLDTMSSTPIISADIAHAADSSWCHYFSGIAIAGDNVYVQAFGYTVDASWNYTYSHRVYETTIANLGDFTKWTLFRQFDATAYGAGIAYDSNTKILWVNVGNGIYGYDGPTETHYTNAQVGGNIGQLAIITMSGVRDGAKLTPVATPAAFIPASADALSSDVPAFDVASLDVYATRIGVKSSDLIALGVGGISFETTRLQTAAESLLASGNTTVSEINPTPLFETTVSAAGNLSVATFELKGSDFLAEKPEDINLIKVKADFSGIKFTYAATSADYTDGHFTVLTSTDAIASSISSSETYKLVLYIKDNGDFDLDKRDNYIADPALFARTSTTPTPTPTPDGGSSGGCAAGTGAAALLALLPLMLWRRKK
ncbi:MAG: Synerg-CTERM sorting domain-containing protein [Synergistaceae bacterium]|nr:Synerg-CTERM sorting domain-containing protein [Synergistaceae bacterium]